MLDEQHNIGILKDAREHRTAGDCMAVWSRSRSERCRDMDMCLGRGIVEKLRDLVALPVAELESVQVITRS